MVKVEDEKQPGESDSVLGVKRLHFPVDVAEWVLKESGDVLEGSPFLGHISWLSSGGNKLGKISISLLCQSSVYRKS